MKLMENAAGAPLDMEKEENRALVRNYEDNLLDRLLAAANFQNEEIYNIDIIRNGVMFFSFRVRPLSKEEFQDLLERYTGYKKNRYINGFDRSAYLSNTIYTATVPEDQKAVWGDNNGLWRKLDVLSGPQAIEKILKAGEMERFYERILAFSGIPLKLTTEGLKRIQMG